MSLPSLNLLGPGRLGRSLARLFVDAGVLRVQAIVGRSRQNATGALAFIGAGELVPLADLPPADFTLIATADDAIAGVAAALARQGRVRPGDVVFHCSGALGSEILAPLQPCGAHLASLHPLRSFAVPEKVIAEFSGTVCAAEGDGEARQKLEPLFAAIGGKPIAIAPEHKLLYHAGAVLACNHLVALIEAALVSLEAAGLPRDAAWAALRPLIDGTLANIDARGTQGALTGPLARGDLSTVLAEIAATAATDPELGRSYAQMSRFATRLLAPDAPITLDQLPRL
ncbi:Rossmann-like and DUF2520 domain-containing protein [Niveibacterium terrae]|uniref:Rossmann-like and DUF2520 domain-containing protein n=1 Tax=Niveibacterium terrae TaxID=3373598 RepID=UPI003A9219D4